MTLTAADVLIEDLRHWGVEVIFGLPGDGINGIMESAAESRKIDPLYSGPPRGGGGIHGVRLG